MQWVFFGHGKEIPEPALQEDHLMPKTQEILSRQGDSTDKSFISLFAGYPVTAQPDAKGST